VVDVNEQNPQAIGFYEHIGFKKVARSPLDEQGKPYPLFHFALE
jgi:putative acetyltransferase